MSIQATRWAKFDAPNVPTDLVSTLDAVADSADSNGRNSRYFVYEIAHITRKSERQTIRNLAKLATLGLIAEGDQRCVQHLPPRHRPTVYDCSMANLGAWDAAQAARRAARETPTRPVTGVRSGGAATCHRGQSDLTPVTARPVTGVTHSVLPSVPLSEEKGPRERAQPPPSPNPIPNPNSHPAAENERPPVYVGRCAPHGNVKEPGPCVPCRDARLAHNAREDDREAASVATHPDVWCHNEDHWGAPYAQGGECPGCAADRAGPPPAAELPTRPAQFADGMRAEWKASGGDWAAMAKRGADIMAGAGAA